VAKTAGRVRPKGCSGAPRRHDRVSSTRMAVAARLRRARQRGVRGEPNGAATRDRVGWMGAIHGQGKARP
jgi:hypothetical protein